ncbi:MAG TPA: MFS transporter [Aggregatilinea sp.]|jgi:MFS family permease|uniref:MFS transporter n=1 Tax=Aggregatilinea sp. TaxID=2806333 RepID=UPI002D1905A3|nr:MFS transporter [Aggregatilinea sp.]HML23323.1 MFS transporter [Aggregatilinea sp.]
MDPQQSPSTTTANDNFRHLVLDVAFFGLATPALSRFLSVYAIRLDADAMLLGWLTALPFVFQMLSSSLAATWRKRFPDTVAALFWPGLFYRLTFLLPAFTPFFPREWQPVWLVVSVALPALPQGISSVLFLVILREGTETGQLSPLMSRRSFFYNITVAVGTVGMGLLLEEGPFPLSYQIMYVIAFILVMVSLLHVNHVKILSPEPILAVSTSSWRLLRSPEFQRIAFVAVTSHIAFFTINALIPLRLVEDLGADEGFMSIFGLFELIAAAMIATQSPRIARKIGTRSAIGVGMLGASVAALVLALANNLYVTLPASALSGASWTLSAINIFNYFSETSPRENLTRYSTLYNQIVALALFVAPMAGSKLVNMGASLTAVLLLGAVMRLVAGLIIPMGELKAQTSRMRLRRATR